MNIEEDDLVENPYAKFEDRADVHVPSATLQIYKFINEKYGRPEADVNVNRASSATMCPKRRQYQRKGTKGTPLTPRKLVNFMMGDLAEMTMLFFISEACVGSGKLYSEVDFGEVKGEIQISDKLVKTYHQKTLTVRIPIPANAKIKVNTTPGEDFGLLEESLAITCHGDGWGKRNSDGKWESIECKSAANWGFQSFQKDGPEDYLKQSHTVMSSEEAKALGVTETRYFYLRKETGHIWDRLVKFDRDIWDNTRQEFLAVMGEQEIKTPFSLIPEMTGRSPNKRPTGRYVAQFPCTYCPYLETCQGSYKLEWANDQWGNQKPSYVFEKKVF